MAKNDANFDALMHLAAEQSLQDGLEEFDAADISGVSVSGITSRKIRTKILLHRIRDSKALRYAKYAVLVFAAAVTLLFAAMMCIQPIRAGFRNMMMYRCDKYVSVRFFREDGVEYPRELERFYLPSDLPEGWVTEPFMMDSQTAIHRITGADGESVWCYQAVFRENRDSFRFDEETETKEMTLPDGTPAYLLISPSGDCHLTWAREYEFVLYGESVSEEILIEIAESMQ
ncbi:MAG: DUF4367 domain-containing protein [Clostridia bacterium]|nr:DUF4367 domain-containing protein [Clostridia bacterium]